MVNYFQKILVNKYPSYHNKSTILGYFLPHSFKPATKFQLTYFISPDEFYHVSFIRINPAKERLEEARKLIGITN